MRIIRGLYKGKIIHPPKGFKSRPTTDYAKESLFNILENSICFEEIKVLDLFSGTGNISYEFLSRGCKEVVAVELNKRNIEHIKKNLADLFPGKGKVIQADVFKFCKQTSLDFDLIFADPPFDHQKIETLPQILFQNTGLKNGALIIIEHPNQISFSECRGFKEVRKYGNISFSFFENR